MNVKLNAPTVILLIVVAMFVVGSLLVYPLNPNSYSAKATSDANGIDLTMDASTQSEYWALEYELIEGRNIDREILFYYDESYANISGNKWMKNSYDSIKKELEMRHYSNSIRMIDADELKNVLKDTGNASKYLILVTSGALPNNVFAFDGKQFTIGAPGTEVDIIGWMNNGGMMSWWAKAQFGYFSAPKDPNYKSWLNDEKQPIKASESLFNIQLADGSASNADKRTTISKELSINQNKTDFAVKCASNVMDLGYVSDAGYSSMGFVKYGLGGAIIVGGEWMWDTSLAHIICSGVYAWKDHSAQNGTVHGKKTIHFDYMDEESFIYVYYNCMYPRYATTLGPFHQ